MRQRKGYRTKTEYEILERRKKRKHLNRSTKDYSMRWENFLKNWNKSRYFSMPKQWLDYSHTSCLLPTQTPTLHLDRAMFQLLLVLENFKLPSNQQSSSEMTPTRKKITSDPNYFPYRGHFQATLSIRWQFKIFKYQLTIFELQLENFKFQRKLEHCPIKLQRWYLCWKWTTGMTIKKKELEIMSSQKNIWDQLSWISYLPDKSSFISG